MLKLHESTEQHGQHRHLRAGRKIDAASQDNEGRSDGDQGDDAHLQGEVLQIPHIEESIGAEGDHHRGQDKRRQRSNDRYR